ncbi:helix-turn-helix transcriptional regulator [Sporolactobacillus sp. STCC-11]|uniref:helix-turn-helix domain-containing protein n=1 Tax=Sporolactobacillus caesalpiniae TaxID=3230362 RepID=UPI0033965FA8
MATFSDRLKELREDAQLKQEEVAKRLRISTSAYGYYEQGRNEPSLDTLLTLSELFHTTIDYLVGKSDDKRNTDYITMSNDKLTTSDKKLLLELKKYPELFDGLTSDPENRIAALDRYWKFLQNELRMFQ